jgi:ubiquinone/menaquinone biosynthesis C-methylase UbiE
LNYSLFLKPNKSCSWETVIKNGQYNRSVPDSWVIKKLLRFSHNKECRNFLDLGSGLGRHLKPMIGRYNTCVGFDISDTSLKKTSLSLSDKGYPSNMVKGHFRSLPFRDNTFSTVLAWRCIYLQNIGDIIESIKEIKRVLCSGGYLICSVRSTSNSLYYIGLEIGQEIEQNTFYFSNQIFPGLTYHFFSKKEIIKTFHCFQIVEMFNASLSNTIFTQNDIIHKNDFWVVILRK